MANNYLNRILKGKQTTPVATPSPLKSNKHPLIDLRQVVKIYQTPAGSFTALKGINLTVEAGQFAAVIGKSGSGKSTLINMVTGIDVPTLGEVYIGQTPVHTLNRRQMARWRGRNVGIVFQFFQLFPTLTLLENIIMPMEFCSLYTPRQRRERAMYLLDLVDIADQAHKLPTMVSGGQQQRVAIARALANDPLILIADEPTGSLDSKTADTIFLLFEDLIAQGKTILMVTHDQDLANRVSRIVLIVDGEIVDKPLKQALPELDNKLLVDISAKLTPTTYKPGQIIFQEGDEAQYFYIILKGQVEIIKEHASGNTVTLANLERGQYFGEMALLNKNLRSATARANSKNEVILMGLDHSTFVELLQNSEMTQDNIAHLMRQRTTTTHLMNILPKDTHLKENIAYETLFYKPGHTIFKQGDPADKFYLIAKGDVEVLDLHHENKVIARLTSGQYFGEMGLLQQQGLRTKTVRAAPDSNSDIELLAISEQTFRLLKTENKALSEEIALTMHRHISENLNITN